MMRAVRACPHLSVIVLRSSHAMRASLHSQFAAPLRGVLCGVVLGFVGSAALSWDFGSLFRRHANDIAAALRRRGLTEETAADLTQDTFVRVIASPPGRSATTHNPAAYLFRVARNLSLDHRRRERLLTRIDLTPDDFAAIVDPSPSPETSVYDRQRLALTRAALAELPERTRVAFEMHRIEEMTIAEVAAELDLSVSRTWSLIRDAYEHIDARLTGL